jgi:hypothetical protein
MSDNPQLDRFGRTVQELLGSVSMLSWYGYFWEADASSSQVQIYLPRAIPTLIGSEIFYKKDSSVNEVMIFPWTGQTINGNNFYTLKNQWDCVTLFNDGTDDVKVISEVYSSYPLLVDSGYMTTSAVSSEYQMIVSDYVIYVRNMTGDVTVTLPSTSDLVQDKVYTVIKDDNSSYFVKIVTNGIDKIRKIPNDLTQYAFNTPYQSVDLLGCVSNSKFFIK